MKHIFRRPNFSQGFSFVELIVAIAIITTLSAIFLFNYGSFERRVTINILAHQIAGWVYDAQVSAMSVKRARNEAGRFPGYGLYFDMATVNKFIFIADLNGNRVYDPYDSVTSTCGDPSEECEQEIILLRGNTIASLCGNMPSSGGQSQNCASANPAYPPLYPTGVINIVFARPNPFDATIWGDVNTAVFPQVPTAYTNAEIAVTSSKGYRNTVTIWSTGQVSVR